MPELLLLRHAKSDWKDAALDDFDRPLSKRGRQAAPRMGEYLRAQGLEPNLVLCSSARRARETLKLVLTALASEPEISYLKSLYLAPPSRMLAILRRQSPETGRILLIAHNPGLERLALGLARGAEGQDHSAAAQSMAEKFPTAALARFRVAAWASLGEAPAELAAFVRPRDLEDQA
ncbi:SixA phosphatase family protein [Pelagibius marinus]|uniref:SixA phosphatase family protein n=1 Tax=Pelagibius marinus TaxID=2762760 RepID=UPI0018728611|nr:histidine phosphatase family protein [Pelagibius marinus]